MRFVPWTLSQISVAHSSDLSGVRGVSHAQEPLRSSTL